MAPADELERIATAAARPGERLTGVLAAELLDGRRVYLCAYASGAWLAVDQDGQPVTSRQAVREAASLAALVEVAEETVPDRAAVAAAPRLATNAYLDSLGAAARRFEREQGIHGASPFAASLEGAYRTVEGLVEQILARHLTPLA